MRSNNVSKWNGRTRTHRTKIHRWVAYAGVAMLLVLLNGCASLANSDDLDPWQPIPGNDPPIFYDPPS
jgi:hypothetical protein